MIEVTPVLAESAYPASAPGSRVRIVSFAPYLSRHGVELSFRPTLTDGEYSLVISGASANRKARVLAAAASRLLRRGRVPDEGAFLVHRLRFLLPLPAVDPPPRIDAYDFDDALFVGSTMHENRRFAWAKREAARWRAYTGRARVVIAGNAYLATHAREHAQRVEVVPSCVDPSVQPTHEHGEPEVVRVGWIGSKSTAVYLEQCLPVLERLNCTRRRAELVLVGAETPYDAPWIQTKPWSLDREKELLASFDIGIMPLPDDEWTRGKCGYKLLQYFAAGVPAVASPVGVNRDLVGDERGILASSDQEWLKALERLVGDAPMRQEMGFNARRFVERQYSYERWAPRLAELLTDL